MKPPKYLRKKSAKGRDYYYFDTGQKTETGRPILTPLPSPKAPGFGDAYARAKAARTSRRAKQGILTFDGLIRLYERSPEFHGLAHNSKRSYSLYLGKANSLLRDRRGDSPPAAKIERQDILAVRSAMADNTGAANQMLRSVGALYAWAIENGKAKDNPAKGIKKYKTEPHKKWPDELVEEGIADPQVGMAVALFYFTGQRLNEVIKMSWRDVEGDHMRVYAQKTKSHLRVAIMPELMDMLKARPKDSVAILTNANGQPWSPGGLRDKLQAWAKERGHQVVPHGLRKNAVCALLDAGCTTAEVSGITDHSIPMVEHYAKERNKLHLGRAAVVKFDTSRKARNKA